MSRNYSISLNGDRKLEDIALHATNDQLPLEIPDKACLRFLSVVKISRIALYITIGSPCTVSTSNCSTENWFRDVFLSNAAHPGQIPWWTVANRDSPLGVLVGVQSSDEVSHSSRPRITELLLYASHNRSIQSNVSHLSFAATSTLSVQALALSSDLLYHVQDIEPTPPASPTAESAYIDGCFRPDRFPLEPEVVNEPPIRKRKGLSDPFDEANERRKKARRKGGEGVSATASSKTDTQVPRLKHQRSSSHTQLAQLQTRPLSRSPSITSRPPTAAAQGQRPSTLWRVQSVTANREAPELEMRNKDIISRIVMAGMRFHGLSQSKSRKVRAGSSTPSPAVDATFDEHEAERRNDEEFKLIYHQVFKGTCFAFRTSIAERSLQPSSEAIRDIADKLLAIFCNDTIAAGFESRIDKVTPTGREASAVSILVQWRSFGRRLMANMFDTLGLVITRIRNAQLILDMTERGTSNPLD